MKFKITFKVMLSFTKYLGSIALTFLYRLTYLNVMFANLYLYQYWAYNNFNDGWWRDITVIINDIFGQRIINYLKNLFLWCTFLCFPCIKVSDKGRLPSIDFYRYCMIIYSEMLVSFLTLFHQLYATDYC